MRDFPLTFSVLALTPGAWAFFSLEFYFRNGSPHLLISSIAAMAIALGLVILDVVIVLKQDERKRYKRKLRSDVRARRTYGHHLNRKG